MKRLTFKNVAGLAILLGLTTTMIGYSAGNTSEQNTLAKVKIKTSIVLTKVQDLLFTDAYQGDAAETVANGASGAASFTLTGDNSKTYNVTFPDGASINMITGAGDTAQKQIVVNAFTHDSTGVISGGVGSFHVGATRAAILADQVIADDYQGSFRVRVTYN